MESKYKVNVFLEVSSDGDDDSLREAVKNAMIEAVELDDSGEQELDFDVVEVED